MIGKNKFKYSILTALGSISLLGSVVGASASDGNLLENPEFLDGVWHWSAASDIAQYGATEIQSMYVMNTASDDAGIPAVVYQCVEVSGGASYHFEASVTINPNQPKTGAAWLATYWWDGDDCGGSQVDLQLGERVTQSTSRLTLEATAPENARSVWAAVAASHDPAAPKPGDRLFATLWDDVYFGLAADEQSNGPAESGEPTAPATGDEGIDSGAMQQAESDGDSGLPDPAIAAGVAGIAMVAVGGAVLLPARRKR